MSGKQCGELSQKSEIKCDIEWTIKDMNSFVNQDKRFHSPIFTIPGSQWFLEMDPNSATRKDITDYISLNLKIATGSTFPKKANFSFGVRKADGNVELMGKKFSYVFYVPSAYRYCKFLKKSILEFRRSELTSAGFFTVTCTLEANDNFDCTSRLIKLSENFEDMFTSKRLCDGKFKVKQEEFPIHKTVLASRCPVFAAMFEVDMKEKTTGIVEIEDCEPGPFRDFLVYLYSGKFQTASSNVWELFKIADKYGVKDLKTDCALFISNNLTVESVFDAVILGDQYNEILLISKSQDFFNDNFSEIVQSTKWDLFNKNDNTLANRLLKNMGEKLKLKKIKLDPSEEFISIQENADISVLEYDDYADTEPIDDDDEDDDDIDELW